jgi:hypothetical protein
MGYLLTNDRELDIDFLGAFHCRSRVRVICSEGDLSGDSIAMERDEILSATALQRRAEDQKHSARRCD